MILRYARSKGGKYELRLYQDADGTYSVREFVNGSLQFASVGWEVRIQADLCFNGIVFNAGRTYHEQTVQEVEHAVHVRG